VVSEQLVQEPSVPAEAEEAFNPALLTPEDVQAFVSKAIQGEVHRKYSINPPPTHRPVRIYADGESFSNSPSLNDVNFALTQYHME
jgi:hypothetical protein